MGDGCVDIRMLNIVVYVTNLIKFVYIHL
jgi:hypothetical protein